MKTLMIFNWFGEEPSGEKHVSIFLLDGDYSRFDGVIINASSVMNLHGIEEEGRLTDLMFDHESGELLRKGLTNEEVKQLIDTIDDYVIVRCGFLP